MKYIKENKKFIILYSIAVVLCLFLIVFTYNNHELYEDTIAKITDVEEKYITTETISYGYTEEIYEQTLKAKILNGKNKNESITIKNEYHKGQAYDQKYKKGDEVFVSLNERENKIINSHIEDYKRDKYIVIITSIFILSILLIGKLKGFFSLISVIMNITIFYIFINLNTKGISLILLSFIGTIIFSTISLLLSAGINKKSASAIVSTITTIIFNLIISYLVIYFTKYDGIRFEQMDLLTRPYEGIFISEIILGCLGAIMDISITISSSLNELIEKNNKITLKELAKSGIAIGKDVMGTMINVLFFTYICGILPNITIYFRNGIELGHLINEYISLEMTRALTGAIGITICIPISIIITLLFYKRRLNHE